MPSPTHKNKVSEEYRRVSLISRTLGESNDCAVVAMSFASGVSYGPCRDMLLKMGRKPGGQTGHHLFEMALAELGFAMDSVPIRDIINRFPGRHANMKNMTTYHPTRFPEAFKDMKGSYLLTCKGHVAAMVDGVVHDWSAGRLNRVWSIQKVTKKVG